MAFVNALPALLATQRTYRATLDGKFLFSKFQHGAHGGFSLVHRVCRLSQAEPERSEQF